jgi:hypothetical protein
LQAKLTIGASNDPLEQEADRVADQVLAAPLNSAVSGAPPRIQRHTERSTGLADTTPASVDRVLASSGRPLEPVLRQDMEQRFGYDFSRVRVHIGGEAEQSARDVRARAYTVGPNVVFGAGRFSPATHEGRRLIAHELTHVVQQSDTMHGLAVMRSPVLDSYVEMKHRVKKGETKFHVADGGLIITSNGNWEPSEEWEGEGRPKCPDSDFNITLNKQNRFIDDEYGTCEFQMGTDVSRQWTNLPDGDYYLTIWLGASNPNCVFRATVRGSQEKGLSGETCTKPPPGPMEMLHDALAAAGLFPVLGVIPDAIDAGIYVVQGDWGSAGISAAAMIPIFGDAATIGRTGAKMFARIEGKAVLKIGTSEITRRLKAIKVGSRLLKLPTYKALRATVDIDERLLEIALQHRAQLLGAGAQFGSHNVAVVKVLIDGKPVYMSARNVVGELHSEARLIQQVDEMIANKKVVEVLQIFSERVPCSKAGCMKAINSKYPKADVFYGVSEELAESAGSKAEALKVIYGLKP